MWGISKARLECLRRQYAPGTRVELVEMNDRQAPPRELRERSCAWMTSEPFMCTGITAVP